MTILSLEQLRWKIRYVVLSLICLAVVTASCAEAITIARDGRSLVPIILPANPTPVEELLAEDLAEHLKKITGADFAIHLENMELHAPAIWIGMTKRGEQIRHEYKDRGGQTLLIRADENGLILTGTDEDGTRHAVYEWLYELGCRWYLPYAWGQVVPEISTLEVSPTTRAYSSPFSFRYGRDKFSKDPYSYKTWKRRNHAGGDRSGWLWHGGGHSWLKTLVPPKEYFDDHPEWYSLVAGTRKPSQLCVTNPQVVDLVCRKVLEWQRGRPLRVVWVSPSDHGETYCTCETCRKLNVSEQIVFLANEAARAMRDEFPDAYVTFYASYHTADVPVGQLQIEPNIMPYVVYRFPDWAHPVTSPSNISLQQKLQFWGQQGNPLGLRSYAGIYADGYSPIIHCIVKDIPYYRKCGVIHVYYETRPRWGTQGLNHYMITRMLWRPDSDPQAILEEYYRLFFGPAAKTMQNFYDFLETTMAESHEFRVGVHARAAAYHRTFSRDALDHAGMLLDKAAKEVANDDAIYEKRIEMLRYVHKLVKMDKEVDDLRLAYGRRHNPAILRRAIAILEGMTKRIERQPEENLFGPVSEVDKIERRSRPFKRALARSNTTIPMQRYSYKDYLDGGGKVPLNAISWEGFDFAAGGLELSPGKTGRLLYPFSCETGGVFKAAEVKLHLFPDVEQLKVKYGLDISTDGGKTWKTIPYSVRDGVNVGTLEEVSTENILRIDITREISGKANFVVRFWANNPSWQHALVLDFFRMTSTGTAEKR